MTDRSNLNELSEILKSSKKTVFFGGAGVSTESGIPDFRSAKGLYNLKYEDPPETILSHSFFMAKPDKFYKFYFDKILMLGEIKNVKPNSAHLFLSRNNIPVITQNIDALHTKSNSYLKTDSLILELHGCIERNYCTNCNKFYNLDNLIKLIMKNSQKLPFCDDCASLIKPDVVLYEEGLNNSTLNKTIECINKADTLIIGGTSLTVYPAASLATMFNGKNLILINKDKTSTDYKANLIIREPIATVFEKIEQSGYFL